MAMPTSTQLARTEPATMRVKVTDSNTGLLMSWYIYYDDCLLLATSNR